MLQAINWAIKEQVDVISMSFVLDEGNHDQLKKAVVAAETQGIYMTCSTPDEGDRIPTAFPASIKTDALPSLFALAACDTYGRLLRDLPDGKFSYKICGHNVPVGAVPFLKSSEWCVSPPPPSSPTFVSTFAS